MVAIIHKIGRIPNKIIVIKITEANVIIGNREVDLITGEIIREAEVITKMTRNRIVGAEAMEGVVAMNKVRTIIGQTTSMEEAVVTFVDHGEPAEPIREVMVSPCQVLGDPQYKGIPQYKYICGICHSRGHYDHQCHTLQHLFYAMQQQSGQHMPTTQQ